MWFLILTLAWTIAKLVVFFFLLAYLWSIVTEKCEVCAENMSSGGRPAKAPVGTEGYRAFRSIGAA